MSLIAKYMYPGSGYYPIEELEVGKEYTVENVIMGGSYTDIYLSGFCKSFNSVNFDFYEDGEPIDIYRSPKYNTYIRRYIRKEDKE